MIVMGSSVRTVEHVRMESVTTRVSVPVNSVEGTVRQESITVSTVSINE